MKKPAGAFGFSLVEVTLALGIAAFTMIAIFGLMPVGMNAAYNSSEQTIATTAATQIIADLRAASPSDTVSPAYNLSLAGGAYRLDEGGRPIGAAGGRYRAILNMTSPGAGSYRATTGTLTITWPAEADPQNALGRFQTFFALTRNQP